MSYNELKNDLVIYSKKCYERHLICATGGNISCRIPGENAILIKKSGCSFNDMTCDDVITIDLDGHTLAGEGKCSKEWRFHTGIYKVRSDVNVVIHVHPPYATAVAARYDELPLITNHAKDYLIKVPTIAAHPSGSEKLAELVVEQFEIPEMVALLMKEHGITTVGANYNKAFYLAEMVEDTAQIALFNKMR